MRFKTYLVIILLFFIAFGVGYVLGYWKFYDAEKQWTAARNEMESKLQRLINQLAQAKARENLRELSDQFGEILIHLTEKNFGLAGKVADSMREKFLALQPSLSEETKGKLGFLVPALEEIKKESEAMSPNTRQKVQELKARYDQALKMAQ
jgi:hypothetical protein